MAKARPVKNEEPHVKRLRAHATHLVLSKRHDLAEPALRQLLATKPNDSSAHRQLAGSLLSLRRIDEALEEAQIAVSLDPASTAALSVLGSIYMVQGRHEQAIAAHEQAMQIKPDYLPAIHGLASAMAVKGRWPEALEWADRGLALRPDHIDLLRIRGKALAIEGRAEDAVAAMEQFLRLSPDQARSHEAAAVIMRRLGRIAEATDFAERAMSMNPANPDSHNSLALLKLKERKFDDAERHFKSAGEIYDSRREGEKGSRVIEMQSLMGQAAVNLNKRRFSSAELQYRRILEYNPLHNVAKALLAGSVGALNRHDEALMLAYEAVEGEHKSTIPLRILAALLCDVERFDESIEVIEKALKHEPDSAESHQIHAAIFISQEQYSKALDAAERAMSLKSSASHRRALAAALAGLGRKSEAVDSIGRALEEERGTFNSEAGAGFVFYLLGDHLQAEAHLLKAISLDESGLGGHGWLGLVYAAQGRTEEARPLLTKSLGLKPYQWRIRTALAKLVETKLPQ